MCSQLYYDECFHCKTRIAASEFITIDDPDLTPPGPRTYHSDHFFCAECGDPFVDPKSLAKGREYTEALPYIAVKGYAYCEKCDLRKFRPRCASARCNKAPIAADWLEAGGKKWHEDCFRCVVSAWVGLWRPDWD